MNPCYTAKNSLVLTKSPDMIRCVTVSQLIFPGTVRNSSDLVSQTTPSALVVGFFWSEMIISLASSSFGIASQTCGEFELHFRASIWGCDYKTRSCLYINIASSTNRSLSMVSSMYVNSSTAYAAVGYRIWNVRAFSWK